MPKLHPPACEWITVMETAAALWVEAAAAAQRAITLLDLGETVLGIEATGLSQGLGAAAKRLERMFNEAMEDT